MLRNKGIISPSEYVGKTVEDAKKYAEDGGFTTRITQEDDKSYMITHDVNPERLNFVVSNGFVTMVYGG